MFSQNDRTGLVNAANFCQMFANSLTHSLASWLAHSPSRKLRYERPRLPEAERVCLVCNEPNAVENELHFLLKCPAYDVIRRDLLSKIPDLDEDFLNWDSNRQLKLLSCDTSSVKLTAQYIIDAFDLRSTIL